MAQTSVRLEIVDRVARVTLARPEIRNAFDSALIAALTDTFYALAQRTDIIAVLLAGEGKSFCSGADLNYMKSMANFSLDENVADANTIFTMYETIRACPHPVIARVQGHAMAGALGLVAVSDVVAAVEGTQFCFTEVRLGLIPAVISTFTLERMAPSPARRYMITGEVFGTSEALASGLIHFAGAEADVDSFVEKTLKTLRGNGPEAMRATKALLKRFSTLQVSQDETGLRRDVTARAIAERRVSAEGQEGLQSFLNKREPSWKASK